MRVLLTGASGFVGSHVLRHLLTNTIWDVVCPVTFRHKGLPARISSAMDNLPLETQARVTVVRADLTAPIDAITRSRFGAIDAILNVASESHVDRSITDPADFIKNNVMLMLNLLDYAREIKPFVFMQMSTDEVYGPASPGFNHHEWSVHRPSNPYSASKAAQENIAFSYWRTYGVPIVMTNTMNIVGEMQDPEKFVPKIIRNVIAGVPVPVHVSPGGVAGSRFYLHARNLADAWVHLLNVVAMNGVTQYDHWLQNDHMRFNIVGDVEIDNIEMVRLIAEILDKEPIIQEVDFHSSRPGHDLRYGLDGSLLRSTGWHAPIPIEEALQRTVEWTLKHPEWLHL